MLLLVSQNVKLVCPPKRDTGLFLRMGLWFVPQKGILVCSSKRDIGLSLKKGHQFILQKGTFVPQKGTPVCPPERDISLSPQKGYQFVPQKGISVCPSKRDISLSLKKGHWFVLVIQNGNNTGLSQQSWFRKIYFASSLYLCRAYVLAKRQGRASSRQCLWLMDSWPGAAHVNYA